jgi:hypothetical protein
VRLRGTATRACGVLARRQRAYRVGAGGHKAQHRVGFTGTTGNSRQSPRISRVSGLPGNLWRAY